MTEAPPIPLSKWMSPVQVTHIENCSQVWVSLDEAREEIMTEVDTMADQMTKLDGKKAKVGDMVAAVFSQDGAVYRAIVQNISKNDVDVLFCDFGNGETVDINDLLELPKDLASKPPVAVLVNIDGQERVEDNEKNRSKVEKKLMVDEEDELMVKLSNDANYISAKFAVNGKKVKFGRSKETGAGEELSRKVESKASEQEVQAAKEEVKVVEITKSSDKVIMCSQLPALEILKKVKYDGLVNYVSALGTVWFRPSWTFPSIDDLSAKFEDLGAKGNLQPMEVEDVRIGLLCVARNGVDGLFYRARVIQEPLENSVCSVKYIDYGDSERVPLFNIFYFPKGVDMVAPGAEEIILARQPKAQDVQTLLTDTLMDVEGVQLYLEMDETGAKVGRFYVNGEEMKWDEMISTREVFNKEDMTANGEDDVVVESSPLKTPNHEIGVPMTQGVVSESKEVIVPEDVSDKMKGKTETDSKTLPKLTRLVAPTPLTEGKKHKVVLQDVESTSKVWVCREEDLPRIDNIMESLACYNDLYNPAKVPKGAVFGARFSEDNEMYRVGTVAKQEDKSYLVHFIDFGNKESKTQNELFLLPEDLAGEPSAAIEVHLDSGLDNTEENRRKVDALLVQDSLTVTIENGKGKFSANENLIKFTTKEEKVAKEAKPSVDIATELQHSKVEATSTPAPKTAPIEEAREETLESTHVNVSSTFVKNTSVNVESQKPVFNKSGEDKYLATPLHTSVKNADLETKSRISGGQGKTLPSKPAHMEKPKVNVKESQCFVKAVKDIQTKPAPRKRPDLNQDKARRNMPIVCSGDDVQEIPWRQGEAVVVKCSDGLWREAKIIASKMSRVFVSTFDNDTVWVEAKNVRSSSIPAEALNKIDKDINSNTMIRETGDGADLDTGDILSQAVDKVKNWMEKNANTQEIASRFCGEVSNFNVPHMSKKLPEGSKLVDYCRTRPGSEHVQSVLNTSNVQLARNVLTTLLCHCNPMSLITGPSSSYVIQKLISVLPSSDLDAIHEVILTNFLELSLDKCGCRIVQIMLEFSNESQQRQLTSMLCNPNIVMALACDGSGTYVAQACLPHLLQTPDQLQGLVLTILPNIAELGTHPQGTFFLQRLISVLNNYPSSVGLHLLFEELLKGLSQMILSEPGSRFIQAVLKDCPKGVFIRVCNWVVENMESVLIIKPAVFLAREMIILIELAMANDDSWRFILEQFVRALMEADQDSVDGVPLLVTASLHACGHILTREIVSRVNLVSGSLRNEILYHLGANVDTLSFSKTGSYVLKGLETIMI